jgi:hypothetical protein
MLQQLAGWLPQRTFHVACDGAYASLCGAGLERVHITPRIRRDAAVYDLAPPRTAKPGRPRKKGGRLGALPALAAAASDQQPSPLAGGAEKAADDWNTVSYDQRGSLVTRLIWSRRLLWYHVARDTALLLVVVRDPAGNQPDDFFTTDVDADPAWVAAHYAGRWSIEVTFRDAKQHLGAEDPQCWKRRGPQRGAALGLWIHAAIWL